MNKEMLRGKFGIKSSNNNKREINMLKLNIDRYKDRPLKVLCCGAHSDDIEIGCGGTILRLLTEQNNVEVTWVVLSALGMRKEEAIKSANDFLSGNQKNKVIIERFKDGYFPYIACEIKDFFESLKKEISPDVIFTHYRHDRHQDHRVISDLTWNTYRNNLIFEYEVVKYDGDIGSPNFFFDLERKLCEIKVSKLMVNFVTQRDHRWFTEDTFWSMLRLRGVECNALEGHAEAFYSRKTVT
jgi:LmbE family N-acetylglucosaminyl deacetylase